MNQVTFNKDLVLFHPAAAGRDEVLLAAAQHLAELGYVLPAFGQALVDRERLYPTGVPMEEANVAIPHVEGGYVKESAILACVLKEDAMFGSLADKDDRLPVRLVFVLALQNAKSHLSLLQALMKSLQCVELTRQLQEAEDAETVYRLVMEHIFSKIAADIC